MKKSKEPTITVSGFDGEPWGEWNRLAALAARAGGEGKRFMRGGRTFTVVLSDCGVELATRTESLTRGKVTQISFHFTGAVRPDYTKGASQ
jgi:hypothetical protein